MSRRKRKTGWGGPRPGSGAPTTGRTGKAVSVYLDQIVLEQVDRLATANGEYRSTVINRLLRQALQSMKARS